MSILDMALPGMPKRMFWLIPVRKPKLSVYVHVCMPRILKKPTKVMALELLYLLITSSYY